MAKIAVVCPPATGHLLPSIALAGALQDRGHEVTFFQASAIGRNAAIVEQAGFPCRIYGSDSLQNF
jgi:UDP:flavonoid glycosyltransferase YjiC (YdhE family)